MGYYGGWSVKPQLGLSNVMLGFCSCLFNRQGSTNQLPGLQSSKSKCHGAPRIWAPWLNRAVDKQARKCLKAEAAFQKKTMVKVTVSKDTQKQWVTGS